MKEASDPAPALSSLRLEPWHELAYFALVVSELCWIVPWYLLLRGGSSPAIAWIGLVVYGTILGISFLILRLETFLHFRNNIRRLSVAGLIVFGSLFALLFSTGAAFNLLATVNHTFQAMASIETGLPLEFTIILFVCLVVYRGSVLAREGVEPPTALSHLKLGLGMLFLLGLAIAITSRIVSGAFEFALGFLSAGLVGMASARLASLNRLRGGQNIPFNRGRLLNLVVYTGGLALLAILFALFFSSGPGIQALQAILHLAEVAIGLAVALFFLIASPVIALAIYLLTSFFAWLGLSPQPIQQQAQSGNGLQSLLEQMRQQSTFQLSGFKPIILWGVLLVLMVGVILLVRSRSRSRSQASQADYASLLSSGDLLRQLWKDLRQLPDWLNPAHGVHRARQALFAARVRKVYADLLNLAAELKHPRPPSKTPLEYVTSLDQAFPDYASELRLITQAYVHVRYGEYPETQEQVDVVEAAWRRVDQYGQTQLLKRKKAL